MADEVSTPAVTDETPHPSEPEVVEATEELEQAPAPTEPEVVDTPPVETSPEDASAGYEALKSAGVDMSDAAVQDAILGGADGSELLEKFGKVEPVTEPEPEPTEPEGDHGIKVGKKARLTIESEEDAAIMSIKRAKKVTLAEAARIYAGEVNAQEPLAKEGTEPEVTPAASPLDTELAEATDAISNLEAEIKTATDDLEFDEAMKLTRQLTTLQIKQARLEDKRDNQAAASQQSFDSKFEASSQRAMAKFPELESADSRDRLAFDAFSEKRAAESPEIFDNPNWPEVIAEEFSAKYGISATSPAASEDGTKPEPAQKRTVAPLARRTNRTELLDGGTGGSEAPAPADEGNKPLTAASIDELHEQRANMSQADREAFDADMHKARAR